MNDPWRMGFRLVRIPADVREQYVNALPLARNSARDFARSIDLAATLDREHYGRGGSASGASHQVPCCWRCGARRVRWMFVSDAGGPLGILSQWAPMRARPARFSGGTTFSGAEMRARQ